MSIMISSSSSSSSCLEFRFCFLIFVSSITYSVFRFYQTSNGFRYFIHQNDLQFNEWFSPYTKHPSDVSDLEWQTFKQVHLQNKILFPLLHSIGFLMFRLFRPKHLPWFIVSYSTIIVGYLLSVKYLLLIYSNIVFIFGLESLMTSRFPKRFQNIPNYLCFICSIAVLHDSVDDRDQNLLFHVGLSWLNAKLLSCSIDSSDDQTEPASPRSNYLIRLAYLLYFPPFFFGPIYHYSDFAKAINRLVDGGSSWNIRIFFKNILQLFRYIWWAIFLEFALNFVYSSAFQYYVYYVEKFDIWSLCGFGYSLMIVFFLKYFVIYGISRQLAIIDGLDNVIAKPPECIAHIHQTSYLWRRFDLGLYRFLLKYFYKPIIGCRYENWPRKFLATLSCFAVVLFWHGYYDSIIVWVLMNVILTVSESLGSEIFQSLQLRNSHRVQALFAAPYLALAYVSNIFFLSNYDIAMIFVRRIILGFPFFGLLTVLYCICFVCQKINENLST